MSHTHAQTHAQTHAHTTLPLLGLLSEPKIENLYPIPTTYNLVLNEA